MAFEIEKQLVHDKIMPQLNQLIEGLKGGDYFNPRNSLAQKKKLFINAAHTLHQQYETVLSEESDISTAFTLFENELQRDAVFKTLLIQDKKTEYRESQLIKFIFRTTQALSERKISKLISAQYRNNPQLNVKMRQMLEAGQLLLIANDDNEYTQIISLEDIQANIRNGIQKNYGVFNPFATKKNTITATNSGLMEMLQYNQVMQYHYALEESGYKVSSIAQQNNRFTITAFDNQNQKIQLNITLSELATIKTKTQVNAQFTGQNTIVVQSAQDVKRLINSTTIRYQPGQAMGNQVRTIVDGHTDYKAKTDGKQLESITARLQVFPQIIKNEPVNKAVIKGGLSNSQLRAASKKAVNQEQKEDADDSVQAKKQAYMQQQERQKRLKEQREKQSVSQKNQSENQKSQKKQKSPMGKVFAIINLSTMTSILDPGIFNFINPFF